MELHLTISYIKLFTYFVHIIVGVPNLKFIIFQFLIGKSWDVSLKLNFPEVREKHCTVEKISADAWTLSTHVIIHFHLFILFYFLSCQH